MSEPEYTPKFISIEEIPSYNIKKSCPKCGSIDTTKAGKRYNLKGTVQQYRCKKCGTSWSHDGYFRGKHELTLLNYAKQLYQVGLSSRQVADEIAKNAHIIVSNVTICRWMKMFGIIRPKNPHSYNPHDPNKTKINKVTEINVVTIISFADSKHPKRSIVLENTINISEE